MSVAIIPPLTRLPPNATKEERRAAYIDYCNRMVRANPHLYLPRGVKRQWYHLIRQEHPLTDLDEDHA